jgi:hypothetical protein
LVCSSGIVSKLITIANLSPSPIAVKRRTESFRKILQAPLVMASSQALSALRMGGLWPHSRASSLISYRLPAGEVPTRWRISSGMVWTSRPIAI